MTLSSHFLVQMLYQISLINTRGFVHPLCVLLFPKECPIIVMKTMPLCSCLLLQKLPKVSMLISIIIHPQTSSLSPPGPTRPNQSHQVIRWPEPTRVFSNPVQIPTSRGKLKRWPKIMWPSFLSYQRWTWYTATDAVSAARSMRQISRGVVSSPKTQSSCLVVMNSALNASQLGFRPKKVINPALFAGVSSSTLRQQPNMNLHYHAATAR